MIEITPLSQAIALGRLLVPPKPRDEWYEDGSGCARGMALEAVGRREKGLCASENTRLFEKLWPWTGAHSKRPCACGNSDSVSWIIAHLFDFHVCRTSFCTPSVHEVWTLDRLIEWVASIEPKIETGTEMKSTEVQGSAVAVR